MNACSLSPITPQFHRISFCPQQLMEPWCTQSEVASLLWNMKRSILVMFRLLFGYAVLNSKLLMLRHLIEVICKNGWSWWELNPYSTAILKPCLFHKLYRIHTVQNIWKFQSKLGSYIQILVIIIIIINIVVTEWIDQMLENSNISSKK